MTPYEMEEQIKNLDARTTAIEHILPTLATKDDLRLNTEALQDDLRLATKALQHEIETGFQAAKAHADSLNEVTREQIRFVADQVALVNRQMASKEDLRDLRQEMATKGDLRDLRQETATKGDLRDLRQEMATKGDLQQLQRTLSAEIGVLGASRRNKKR
jgi:hypothetical protein